MSSSLRTLLVSSALTFSVGCSFFEVADIDEPVPPKKVETKPAATGGGAGMAGSAGMAVATGGTGTGGSGTGGTGGDVSVGGSAGTGMTGTGGTKAGAGGAMGGSAGAGAGAPPLGGMGGVGVAQGGMGGMSAGAAGMSGAAGGGPVTCASQNAGAMAFGGHCYLLVTAAATFANAKMSCMAMNAHLVTISNGTPAMQSTFDAEDMFVFTLGGGKDTWLGLADGKMDSDPGDGTPYKWITGEDNPPADWGMAYGWVSGEPNNYKKTCASGSGDCYEHCGMMVADQGDKWNDDLCESTKQYVCEWDQGG